MSTESWVIAEPKVIEIADVHEVVVGLTDGAIDVVGEGERATAELEVSEISDRPLEVMRDGEKLRIGYDFAGFEGLVDRVRVLRDKERVIARLRVPAATSVKVSTAQAKASVMGVRAAVSVNTATGPVQVSGCTPKVAVSTASGPITIAEHVGDVRVNTASGKVAVGGQLSRVNVASVAGAVDIAAAEGTPHVSVKTVSGAVGLHLAAGTAVNLRAHSISGKVLLDGAALESAMAHATSVTHTDAPGVASAYISANTVTADVTVTRGQLLPGAAS